MIYEKYLLNLLLDNFVFRGTFFVAETGVLSAPVADSIASTVPKPTDSTLNSILYASYK